MRVDPPSSRDGEAQRARALLLVHGAGSGPWVFDGMAPILSATLRVETVDLQDGPGSRLAPDGAVRRAVGRAAERLPRPFVLVALEHGRPGRHDGVRCADALVLLEASAPGEVQGVHPEVAPAAGVFDPEREYGPFPAGCGRGRSRRWAARSASAGYRCQRSPARPSSSTGRNSRTSAAGGSRSDTARGSYRCPGKSHWDLVLDPEAIRRWLGRSRRSSDGGGGGGTLGGAGDMLPPTPLGSCAAAATRPG